MTIEGLGKKFQEARRARNLTLDEAARITKIRPQRLAEIEADDFSQFPSLAYAKGFLQIYGKFLDVDVTPYLDAFEDFRAGHSGWLFVPPGEFAAPVAQRAGGAPSRSRRRSRSTFPNAAHLWHRGFGNWFFGDEIAAEREAACAESCGIRRASGNLCVAAGFCPAAGLAELGGGRRPIGCTVDGARRNSCAT